MSSLALRGVEELVACRGTFREIIRVPGSQRIGLNFLGRNIYHDKMAGTTLGTRV